jgi:glycosyltransferase involved in cell wall biosynthesis
MRTTEFLYLIQDFEPGFYPWSSAYAQALETYAMPYRALINEQLLAQYLVGTGTGRFAETGFVECCAIFEPAVDRQLFHPVERLGSTRTLLFYARPNQPRNLFGIGFEALCAASAHPVFAETDWRYLAIGGGSLGRMSLGDGRFLEPTPWMSYEDYAGLMREADVLLCPMLSPHTSYPVLEMAACRGIAVTNSFGSKTAERLHELSRGIVAEAPSVEAMTDALLKAASGAACEGSNGTGITLPGDWHTALQATIDAARQMVQDIILAARS